MNLKKSKSDITQDAKNRVNMVVSNKLQDLGTSFNRWESMDQTLNNLRYRVADAVACGVEEGLKEFLENLYTDEEFEKDINLRT